MSLASELPEQVERPAEEQLEGRVQEPERSQRAQAEVPWQQVAEPGGAGGAPVAAAGAGAVAAEREQPGVAGVPVGLGAPADGPAVVYDVPERVSYGRGVPELARGLESEWAVVAVVEAERLRVAGSSSKLGQASCGAVVAVDDAEGDVAACAGYARHAGHADAVGAVHVAAADERDVVAGPAGAGHAAGVAVVAAAVAGQLGSLAGHIQ